MPLPVIKNRNSSSLGIVVPPVVTIWAGNINSTYTNPRNWTNSAPVNGGSVYVVNSSTDITGTDVQTTSLKEFRVGSSYTGNIGTSSSPLKVMAERLVIDNTTSSINIRGSFRDIHIVNGSSRVKVGGSQTRKLNRLMVHGQGVNYEIFDGQCNRLIVSGNGNKVTAPAGITNDNLLATVAGFDEIRCSASSSVVTSSGVNDLNIDGEVEITGAGNIANARMLAGSKIKAATTGKVTGRLTMFGGIFDIRNSATTDTFIITNADLFDGKMFALLGEQDLTFTNAANILGPVEFQLKSGSLIAVS